MQSKLLEGKPLADNIKKELSLEIEKIKNSKKFDPILAAIQVGDDSGALLYVDAQKKFAESLKIKYLHYKLTKDALIDEIISLIDKLNKDKKITGIIIITPLLSSKINYEDLVCRILPSKDVEGMHPENLGLLVLNKKGFVACTPQAVMELLKEAKVKLYGKEVVVVGHSGIVGKPLSLLLLKEFATTTVCHIATSQMNKLPAHIQRAEVLISAVGKPNLIKGEWIRDGAVVIDVGISRVGGKIVGDIEFREAFKKASFITPVPGGVGPLTTAMLMRNIVFAYRMQ